MFKKININYFFFSLWFLLLAGISFFHLPFVQDKTFFIFHSITQIMLEILTMVMLLSIFEKYLPKFKKIFSGLLFFILFFHIINLFMVKLMDSSIFFALNMVFGDGIKSIFTNFRAMDINSLMLGCIIGGLVFIPLFGAVIYHYFSKLSLKKPLYVSLKSFLAVFLAFVLLEFTCEKIIIKQPFNTYLSYINKLPLANSYLVPKNQIFKINNPKKPKLETEVAKIIEKKALSLKKHPNIFIFVIESFRKDSISSSTTPTLQKFKKENISFTNSFAGANGSHLSWFSIFYSQFPLNWNYYQKEWKGGAVPLKILKSLDYKINVFSSAGLNYFNMDKTIFGHNFELAKVVQFEDKNANVRDQKAFDMLKENLQKDDKNLFVVFLDSTHSEYSSPNTISPKFAPVSQGINYFDFLFSSKDLPLLKNRYLNSLNYLDNLFKNFFDHLKKLGLYDDAIIVITADHGEEFYENGSLFHGTHLNHYQTNIPIIYKIPDEKYTREKITSQVDIFPTILHHLTGRVDFDDLFDGQSIFNNQKKSFSIVGSQNGGNLPENFVIYYQDRKIVTQKEEDNLKIIAVKDLDDNDLDEKANEHSFDIFIEK